MLMLTATTHRFAPLGALLLTTTSAMSGCAREHILDLKTLDPIPQGFEVDIVDEAALAPGTVFFTDGSDQTRPRIVEVNRQGEVVWQYHVPSEMVEGTALMDAERTPDGGAVFIVDGVGAFEVDADGEPVRAFESLLPSHDIDLLPDGSWLLTNGWARFGEPHFMKVDAGGDVTWTWDGLDQYDYPPYNAVYKEGWIHANGAQLQDDGTMLVSLRNFNVTALLDERGEPLWEVGYSAITRDPTLTESFYGAAEGRNPHEPELTEDGTLLVALHSPGSVVEIDIATREVIWSWVPEADDSVGIRDVNRLPNGNTLITTAFSIVEIDPTGTTVWSLSSNMKEDLSGTGATLRPFYKCVLLGPDGEVYGG